jgi:hypothetical protein
MYSTNAQSKPEYVSNNWNSILLTNLPKLERIQRKLVALLYSKFLMAFITLNMKPYGLDLIFHHSVLVSSILIPYFSSMFLKRNLISHLFWIVCLHIPTGLIIEYSALNVHHHFRVSPSTGCVFTAIVICRNADIFNKDCTSLAGICHSFI